jgi:hypothetical protein
VNLVQMYDNFLAQDVSYHGLLLHHLKEMLIYENSGSHSGEYEGGSFLGYSAV